MKDFFKISMKIIEIPISKQKEITGGYWDTTLGTVDIVPNDPWPSFSFPSSIPPTYGDSSFGGGDIYEPDPGDNISDPDQVLDSLKDFIKQKFDFLELLKKGTGSDPAELKKVEESLKKALETIDLMEKSDKNYRIEIGDTNSETTVTGGLLSYDPLTNEYVIRIEGTTTQDLALLAHELEHVYQIEHNEVGFDSNGIPLNYDIQDEINAYQQQENFLFNGVTYIDVTEEHFWNSYNGNGDYDHFKQNNNTDSTDDESLSSFSRS